MNSVHHDTITETGIDVAFRKGFHRMVANDMARECRAILDSCPTCQFEGIEADKSYCYKPPYGESVLVIVWGVTPKRTQAIASVNGGEPRRIYKGSYNYGTFIELDADLLALVGITHEMIIEAAVNSGLEVPPEVRRQYPALFTEIPERFANGRFSAAERVKQSLAPAPFQAMPVSVDDVDRWITEAHRSIASLRCERTRRAALNPDTAPDYDQYLNEYRNDIDYYRWLRKLVDVDGIFHIST